MTRTFSDIDDIGGTTHLVENRFRLNGAAAIFARPSIRGKTKEFCILHTSSFSYLLSGSAPRAAAARPAQRAKLPGKTAKADAQHSYPSLAPWLAATSAPS